jgi:hypothetical protein
MIYEIWVEEKPREWRPVRVLPFTNKQKAMAAAQQLANRTNKSVRVEQKTRPEEKGKVVWIQSVLEQGG